MQSNTIPTNYKMRILYRLKDLALHFTYYTRASEEGLKRNSSFANLHGNIYVKDYSKPLGKGGYGVVYKYNLEATLVSSHAPLIVAIKAETPNRNSGLFTEAFAMANDAITNYDVYGIGAFCGPLNPINDELWQKPHYVLMSFKSGLSLDQVSITDSDLLISYFIKLMKSLKQTIHDNFYVHGDINRSNVMVDEKNVDAICMIDLGLARKINEETLGARVYYLAPELFKSVPAHPSQDIYAMGVLFLEKATGISSYDSRSLRSKVIFSHAQQKKEFLNLVSDMKKIQPSERPSAQDVIVRLEKIAAFKPLVLDKKENNVNVIINNDDSSKCVVSIEDEKKIKPRRSCCDYFFNTKKFTSPLVTNEESKDELKKKRK